MADPIHPIARFVSPQEVLSEGASSHACHSQDARYPEEVARLRREVEETRLRQSRKKPLEKPAAVAAS